MCIVEGTQIAWIVATRGLLTQVQQRSLEAASVAALQQEINRIAAEGDVPLLPPVILGQGLVDGAKTRGLGGVVLGRLDGEQPPQWLRPSFHADMD